MAPDLAQISYSSHGSCPAAAGQSIESCAGSLTGARYWFRREGQFWTAIFEAAPVHLKDTKGTRFINHLLRHAGQRIHCVTLYSEFGMGGRRSGSSGLTATSARSGAQVDHRALTAYRDELDWLRREHAEAESRQDVGRVMHLRLQMDRLELHVASMLGRHGRPRRTDPEVERIRINVRTDIANVLKVIQRHDLAFWRHLTNSLRTGIFCSYDPERPFPWKL